jgi:hypothetical protein
MAAAQVAGWLSISSVVMLMSLLDFFVGRSM